MYMLNLKCEKCNKEFIKIVKYKSYKSRYCDKCLPIIKFEVGQKGALSSNPIRNEDDTFDEFKQTIVSFYNANNRAPTYREVCKEMHISNKTMTKILKAKNSLFSEILNQLNIKNSGLSKFQKSVISIMHEIYPDTEIISEKKFDRLVNPYTGCNLRIDIYIPSLKLAIECNGKQHDDINHYYNKVTINNGNTPCYVTDDIKKQFCISNGIELVIIPYKRIITKKYIEGCLMRVYNTKFK